VTDATSDVWHITIETIYRKKMLVITHTITGYTICLYGLRKSDGKNLPTLIENSIRTQMLFDGFLSNVIDSFLEEQGTLMFTTTSNRKIIAQTTSKKQTMELFFEYLDKTQTHQLVVGHKICHLADGKLDEPHNEMKRYLERTHSVVTSYKYLHLEVAIQLTNSAVSRRLIVPSTYTLYELHIVLQKVFGWKNMHLHMFQADDNDSVSYGNPEHFIELREDILDERLVTIGDLFDQWKEWNYVYDFGDDWVHHMTCLMMEHSKHQIPPQCVQYEGDNIPEDVGGIPGYEYYLEIMSDPNHKEYEHLKEWEKFIEYQSFDIEYCNYSLYFEMSLEMHYSIMGNQSLVDRLLKNHIKK
jgi:hypothetical protein